MKSVAFWAWYDNYAAPKLAEWNHLGMDRSNTFRQMFEYLDKFDAPVIVETGCIEDDTNWGGNGCSTILFNYYVKTHLNCSVYSFEIDPKKVAFAQKICPYVKVRYGDSVALLRSIKSEISKPVTLLYLDASDHNWLCEVPSQIHHFNELMAATRLLAEDTLVVIDDSRAVILNGEVAVTPDCQSKVIGKGGLIAQYAFDIGAKFEFCEYQIGFTGMAKPPPPKSTAIESTIERARKHVEAGEQLAADQLYRQILTSTPLEYLGDRPGIGRIRIARGEACANFGRAAHHRRQFGMAIDWFNMAIDSDPLASAYRCDLARALLAVGAMEPAKREAEIAVTVEPENPGAWATLGGLQSDLMNAGECIQAYDKQVLAALAAPEIDPFELSDAYLNRATIAVDQKDYETAYELCDRMLDLKVRSGDAWHVQAIIAYREHRHEEAIALFDKALEHNARNTPLVHWNKSLPMQAIGLLKDSFIEHAWREYERTQPAFYVPATRFKKPRWRGTEPPAVIHVHTEAGHGDNIAMLRYFPEILKLGHTVHYESDDLLYTLVARSFPEVVCMPRAKDYPGIVGLKPFDYHIPIGDLPTVFGTDLDTIPWAGPYLHPDPELVEKYASLIWDPTRTKARKIGLCWSSGIRRKIGLWMEQYGRMKSMTFNDMAPVINRTDTFISLQVGNGRDELRGNVQDILPANPNWDETAALIANLDLVITVDTAVAHLAGAMGKPTWVVMQKDGASWHFMCERPGSPWNDKSPWYPSMRVFRQEDGTWESAIFKVVKALEE